MTDQTVPSSGPKSRALEWISRLSIFVGGLLLFEAITGLWIWLLPFSVSSQVSVLVHTAAGILFLVPYLVYQGRRCAAHCSPSWLTPARSRKFPTRSGRFSHSRRGRFSH